MHWRSLPAHTIKPGQIVLVEIGDTYRDSREVLTTESFYNAEKGLGIQLGLYSQHDKPFVQLYGATELVKVRFDD